MDSKNHSQKHVPATPFAVSSPADVAASRLDKFLFQEYSSINHSSAARQLRYYSIPVGDLSPAQQRFIFQYTSIDHRQVISALAVPRAALDAIPDYTCILAHQRDSAPGGFGLFVPGRRGHGSHKFSPRPRPRHRRQLYLSFDSLRDSLLDALARVKPYLPPSQREECEALVIPQLKRRSKFKLTLSDALALLSLLVSLAFGIASTRPNEQVERIIRQNEVIIEQQAELIRLQEDDDLVDAFQALTDSINDLSAEIRLLQEQLDSSDDSSRDAVSDQLDHLTDAVDSICQELEASGDSSGDADQDDSDDAQQENGDAQD